MNVRSQKKVLANGAKTKKKKIKITIKSAQPWTKFYYGARMGYAFEADPGVFIPLPAEGQVRQHLCSYGISKELIGEALCTIRRHNLVKWMGPVAGYKTGI